MRAWKSFKVRDIDGVLHGTCNGCGVEKALSEYHVDKSKRYGVHTRCKTCRINHKTEVKVKRCATCNATFEIRPGIGLDRKYCSISCSPHRHTRRRLSDEEYLAKVRIQNKKCAICGKEYDRNLSVDHCHATNEIRDLLCGGCNSGLGMLKENVNSISNASEYVLKYRGMYFTGLVEAVEKLVPFEKVYKACPSFDVLSEYGGVSANHELFDSPQDSIE